MSAGADHRGHRVCHWCHSEIGPTELRVSETERGATWLNDWVLCSWACAHELVTRTLRTRADRRPPTGDDAS